MIGVPIFNKEGNVICEIDGRVLEGMQFGVLFEVLVAARAQTELVTPTSPMIMVALISSVSVFLEQCDF